MAKLSVLAGATSQSVNVWLQDSSSTTGAGLSGLVFNSSGLIAYYTFAGANATSVQITLATLAAVTSAYSSGGFKEIDATNLKGLYRLDLPNAALATSKGRAVTVMLSGATNLAPCVLEIELTGWDNQDAVHGGLSALPNVASGSAGALLIDGTGTAAISNSSGKVVLQATQTGVTIPTVTTVTNQLTAAAIATAIWQDLTVGSDFTTVASIGKLLVTDIDAAISSRMATYTQPTGFLAASFPTTVASPTNITAASGVALTSAYDAAKTAAQAGDSMDVGTWVGGTPNALISGRVDSNAQVVGTGAIVSGSFAANAVDASALATSAANEIRDAVWAQAMTELSSVPGVSDTVLNALQWVFLLSRNKLTQTATTQLLRNAADGATIGTSTVSDDGTTGIRGAFS